MTYEEIAVALEVNEKTIRRRWALAKVRLYELITQEHDTGAACFSWRDSHSSRVPGKPGSQA